MSEITTASYTVGPRTSRALHYSYKRSVRSERGWCEARVSARSLARYIANPRNFPPSHAGLLMGEDLQNPPGKSALCNTRCQRIRQSGGGGKKKRTHKVASAEN